MPQAQSGAPRCVCAQCGYACARCLGFDSRPLTREELAERLEARDDGGDG
mgnify:FL=1